MQAPTFSPGQAALSCPVPPSPHPGESSHPFGKAPFLQKQRQTQGLGQGQGQHGLGAGSALGSGSSRARHTHTDTHHHHPSHTHLYLEGSPDTQPSQSHVPETDVEYRGQLSSRERQGGGCRARGCLCALSTPALLSLIPPFPDPGPPSTAPQPPSLPLGLEAQPL